MGEQVGVELDCTDEPEGYTWMIFGDLTHGHTGARIWRAGPGEAERRLSMHVLMSEGSAFRLLDPNGEVAYTGVIAGGFAGPEPLEDFGRAAGCTVIEYTDGAR